ncbi:hypothetical protein ACFFGH_00270 [Lysobacter korlensis]|uniref:Cytochrome C oxidase subunit I n=1 Tax=Lysobacter korlensis TaxID=553636 RepID=A0ABV6RH18_9GAMM
MSLAAMPVPLHSTGSARLLSWLAGGWSLFRRSPVRLFLLSLLPILVEAACQVVPVVGIGVSKLVTPLASAWLWVLVDNKARTGVFRPNGGAWFGRARPPSLLAVAALTASVAIFQLAVAAMIAGPAQAFALATGAMGALTLSRPELALVFASGTVPGLFLTFVAPRVVLDGRTARQALVESVERSIAYWQPVLIMSTITTVLVALVLWAPWVLLVMLPSALCVGYAMYRDVFAGPAD